MTVAEQITKASQIAKANKLTNPHVHIRFPQDIRSEFAVEPLTLVNTTALRSLEVLITNGAGYIYGVVGDHEDGRKNVVFAV